MDLSFSAQIKVLNKKLDVYKQQEIKHKKKLLEIKLLKLVKNKPTISKSSGTSGISSKSSGSSSNNSGTSGISSNSSGRSVPKKSSIVKTVPKKSSIVKTVPKKSSKSSVSSSKSSGSSSKSSGTSVPKKSSKISVRSSKSSVPTNSSSSSSSYSESSTGSFSESPGSSKSSSLYAEYDKLSSTKKSLIIFLSSLAVIGVGSAIYKIADQTGLINKVKNILGNDSDISPRPSDIPVVNYNFNPETRFEEIIEKEIPYIDIFVPEKKETLVPEKKETLVPEKKETPSQKISQIFSGKAKMPLISEIHQEPSLISKLFSKEPVPKNIQIRRKSDSVLYQRKPDENFLLYDKKTISDKKKEETRQELKHIEEVDLTSNFFSEETFKKSIPGLSPVVERKSPVVERKSPVVERKLEYKLSSDDAEMLSSLKKRTSSGSPEFKFLDYNDEEGKNEEEMLLKFMKQQNSSSSPKKVFRSRQSLKK